MTIGAFVSVKPCTIHKVSFGRLNRIVLFRRVACRRGFQCCDRKCRFEPGRSSIGAEVGIAESEIEPGDKRHHDKSSDNPQPKTFYNVSSPLRVCNSPGKRGSFLELSGCSRVSGERLNSAKIVPRSILRPSMTAVSDLAITFSSLMNLSPRIPSLP